MLEDFRWFCFYLFGWKRGIALVHVYVFEHIVSLNYRIIWWIFTNLGRDKILMTPHICIDVLAKSAQEPIQGRAIIGQWEAPSPKNFFFRRKASATNWMHSNYQEAFGKKCCYFLFHSEVKFLMRFCRFGVFLCNFYRFLCGKELYLH